MTELEYHTFKNRRIGNWRCSDRTNQLFYPMRNVIIKQERTTLKQFRALPFQHHKQEYSEKKLEPNRVAEMVNDIVTSDPWATLLDSVV